MVKQPRPPKPDPTDSQETVELLRALARKRGAARPDEPGPHSRQDPWEENPEKVESLRVLAARLGSQLRWDLHGEQDADRAPSRNDEHASAHTNVHTNVLLHEWRRFVAGLPPRAALVPRLGRGRLAFVIIAVAVLAIAAAGRMIGYPGAGHRVAVPGEIVPPTESGAREPTAADLAAISKAMSQCDEAAARTPDLLAFLVLPVVRLAADTRDWRALALQTVGNAYLLLSAKDALDGLRDGSLAVRPGRYTFSVLDPASGASYSWTSATGLSRLERPDSSNLKAIQLGFDFSSGQTGPHWSKLFQRKPGSCYWVIVLPVA